MAIREDDQRLKDMMRAIELGEIEEDILEGDQEDYEDMGGIKSLNRGAPSIKLASETGPEEFELELMSVIREFKDLKEKGLIGPDVTVDQYINDYLSKKKMMMEEKNRQVAMYGGRMQYADGYNPGKMGNPAVMTKIENMREEQIMNPDVEDVADYKTYYKMKKKQDDEIKRMLEKAKEEKAKRAKGGIAGVL